MSFLGLDPTAVRALAGQMRNAASDIQSMTNNLTSMLGQTQWTGPDHDRFANEWQGTHIPQLHQVMSALEQAARDADMNAQQQEQASNS